MIPIDDYNARMLRAFNLVINAVAPEDMLEAWAEMAGIWTRYQEAATGRAPGGTVTSRPVPTIQASDSPFMATVAEHPDAASQNDRRGRLLAMPTGGA